MPNHKGGIGEVALALYFLFCADVLHKARNTRNGPTGADSMYANFLVDFFDLLAAVDSGGRISVDSSPQYAGKERASKEKSTSCWTRCQSKEIICCDLHPILLIVFTFLSSMNLTTKNCLKVCIKKVVEYVPLYQLLHGFS